MARTSSLPEATTQRLHLRPMDISDAPDIFEIRSDWECMKWATGPLEPQLSDTENWMRTKVFSRPTEVLNYSLELLESDGGGEQPRRRKVIGAVGAVRGPEIGYMIAREYWGKGYATEAVRAFLGLYWDYVPRAGSGTSARAGESAKSDVPTGAATEASPAATGAAPDTRDVLAGPDDTGAGAVNGASQEKQEELSALALSRGWDYIEAIIDPENTGSATVLVKCGFRLWSSTKDDFQSVNLGLRSTAVYRMARPGLELGQPPGPFEIDMGPGLT